MDFYNAAVQIIPVLLLTLIVEGQLLRGRPALLPNSDTGSQGPADPDDPASWNVVGPMTRFAALALMTAAEFVCLLALDGHSSVIGRRLVWLALGIGVVAIVWQVGAEQYGYVRRWLASPARNVRGFVGLVALAAAAMAVWLLGSQDWWPAPIWNWW